MVRIIIAGSRNFNDYDFVKREMISLIYRISINYPNLNLCSIYHDDTSKKFKINKENIEIISGMASGADSLGVRFANEFGITLKEFPAKWEDFTVMRCNIKTSANGRKYNSLAGHNRNIEMANYAIKDKSYPVLALFWDEKSKGSANMKSEAKKRGINIFEKIIMIN